MYYLRSRLNRNLGNLSANELYTKLRVGTKRLIEDYNVEVQRALEMICADPAIPHPQKLAFIKETRHSYGRTALLLSGGGTMGLYHLGVIKALHENNLLPQVISGSSAGSIFAALVATRTDQQIAQVDTTTATRPSYHHLIDPCVVTTFGNNNSWVMRIH
jgi:TAG lipase/steryl ester hydrolase/phospholipase A2/LPA acyltransferase